MGWALASADADLGAVARHGRKRIHPSLGLKKFNRVTWIPQRADERTIGLLVLGDSYADHFDMGFECWQTLLGRQCGLSVLNVACGGARISQFRSQLDTATEACGELGLCNSAETLVVVHAGGNDFLQALVLPPVLLLLVLDICRFGWHRSRTGWRASPAAPPLFSFVGLGARWLELQLRWLVAALHRLGYRRVLVSGPIVTPSLPLARMLVTLLTLGLATPSFVDATLRDFGDLLAASLRDVTLPRLEAQTPEMQLSFFDGAGELSQLAGAAREERHGVFGTLRLLAALRRPTPRTTFWRDGHHPTAVVHVELAARAQASLGLPPVPQGSSLRSEAPGAPLLGR